MNALFRMRDGKLGIAGPVALLSTVLVGVASAGEGVVSLPVPNAGGAIDYARARPMPLPAVSDPAIGALDVTAHGAVDLGPAGVSDTGRPGTGKLHPVQLVDPSKAKSTSDIANPVDVEPQEYGTSGVPFTTSRVDLAVPQGFQENGVSASYPNRAAGKIFFLEGQESFVCSGSLIKKGLIVTAAHCVAAYGKKQLYASHQYVPAYYKGNAPYGTWTAKQIFLLPAYFKGTDNCTASSPGVVCQDDIAVIVVEPQAGDYPGTTTGWFGYAYGGYSYVPDAQNVPRVPQISQLGYPLSHDDGEMMQRTDSAGHVDDASVKNTIIGSRQTGGSSGGPWVVNLGIPAALQGTGFGTAALSNVVVGVTSWGKVDTNPKIQGASPFLRTNIVVLVNAACKKYPDACAP